jgi:hypothetical protein
MIRSAILALLAFIAVPGAPPAADFTVAPDGSDTNPGTADRPFATPVRAVEAVRALVAAGLKKDVRVVFRAGTYELAAPLVFTPADSGTEAHSITYAAHPGDVAILSGGRRIANWKKGEGRRWTAEFPDVRAGKRFFRQLVVNDARAVRARWPEADGELRVATVATGVKTFTFNKPLPKESLGGQDAEMVVYQNWSVTRALVASSDEKGLTTATPAGWIGHGDFTTTSPGKPAFLEHARAFLDQPGEWFLDRAEGVLTYLAAEGEDPAKTVAVAPALEQVLRIAGTKEKPVRNLRFEGLRFEHTDYPLPAFGYAEIQAAHHGTTTKEKTHVQPVAVECVYAEECRFERGRFAHLGASGIGFGPGCRKNAVVGCLIEDIGGSGVMIGWRGAGKLKAGSEGALDADWDDPSDAPASNEVSHCHIRRCGADSRGAVGVFAAFSADTRIVRNLIHDMPYTGVSIGYRWNTTPTTQVRCLVEYNHIHDVMKKLADGGGIYTLGFQPGTVLRGNHIHDVHRSAYAHGGAPNNGFFIDEGSKGFLFEANLVYATSGEAVRFNQNKREWHEWKDNLFDQTVPRRAKGKAGSALDCSGGGASLEIPHAASLEPPQFTLEAWVQIPEFPGGEDPRRWVVCKNGNEWTDGHYALILQGKQVGAYLNAGGGQANAVEALSEKDILRTGAWQHLAATFDGAALRVYCDGAPAGAKPAARKRTAGTGPLVIGRRGDAYPPAQFRGLIDEVRVYARALTAAEVAARAKGGGSVPAGGVGTWTFDEQAGPAPAIQKAMEQAGPGPEYRHLLRVE